MRFPRLPKRMPFGLDRRWWFAIAIAVVAIVAVGVSRLVIDDRSADCAPVKDLLAYNRDQAEQIEKKTANNTGLPTVAEDTAYAAWADGLAERAQKVTAPDLAATSTELATLANDFVRRLPLLRDQAAAVAPGGAAPPVGYEMQGINVRISEHLKQLSKTCG